MKMILTTECFTCEYYSEYKDNNQKIHCSLRNKDYFIGQRVPCEDKKQKIGDGKENE